MLYRSKNAFKNVLSLKSLLGGGRGANCSIISYELCFDSIVYLTSKPPIIKGFTITSNRGNKLKRVLKAHYY